MEKLFPREGFILILFLSLTNVFLTIVAKREATGAHNLRNSPRTHTQARGHDEARVIRICSATVSTRLREEGDFDEGILLIWVFSLLFSPPRR